MKIIICHHCKHEWNYNGVQKFYATCPKCRYKVNLIKNKKKEIGTSKVNLDQTQIHNNKNNEN